VTDTRPSSSRHRRNALKLVALAAALLVTTACQGQTEASTIGATTNSGRRGVEVPGVVGVSLSEAGEILEAADVPFVVKAKISDEPPGTVVGQSPREGQRLFPGDFVYLFVSDERPRCYEYAEC
jgi:hypothetical protein